MWRMEANVPIAPHYGLFASTFSLRALMRFERIQVAECVSICRKLFTSSVMPAVWDLRIG